MNAACPLGTHVLRYRHNCLVVYRRRIRDLWRKSYWVVCIYCNRMQGPHREKDDAWKAADALNHHDQLPQSAIAQVIERMPK